ncbi:MAG: lycopene cyclase domain-containing protein [Frankiales bacterium]|nr:lycopene cyclase domain-containing protein [Frankiales bacterium]
MGHLAYLGVLALVVIGSTWLEVALRTRVLSRWRRLLLTIGPVLVVFSLWDAYAVSAGHWSFDPARTTGVTVGDVPLEELLFFVVVPVASLLTLEAVRSARRWEVGDEPPGTCVDGVRRDDATAGGPASAKPERRPHGGPGDGR